MKNLLSPLNRTIKSLAKSPVVFAVDITGSMAHLVPLLFYKFSDKLEQLTDNSYLDDPEFCVAAVGDFESDKFPVQVGEFCKSEDIGKWSDKIIVESGGGGGNHESYELMAYFLANRCEMPNAQTPICIFFGDENFRDNISAGTLIRCFGGNDLSITASETFAKLLKTFKGNVVMVYRPHRYSDIDKVARAQWANVLGKKKVVTLERGELVDDLIAGIIALLSGSRTLNEYVEDMTDGGRGHRTTTDIKDALRGLDSYCRQKFGKERGKASMKTEVVVTESGVSEVSVSSDKLLEERAKLCAAIEKIDKGLSDLKNRALKEDRKIAELLYARALYCAGDTTGQKLASFYASMCLKLLSRLPSSTADDCATSVSSIGGILLPDFLHYDTAMAKFIEAGINLLDS